MAQQLRNQKKKMSLFVDSVLHLRTTKDTPASASDITSDAIGLKTEKNHIIGNGNSSSGGTCLTGDVQRLCKEGQLKEALYILHVMHQQGIRPHCSAYTSLLQKCISRKALPEGKALHTHMIDIGFDLDVYLGTKLVIMYAKCGSLVDARRVFDEMPKRDVVSWTAMIAAYARQGHNQEALALYYRMQREGIQPNKFTFSGVLPACADLGVLEHGEAIHGDIKRSGLQSDVFVGSALVDMYAKCGSIQDAWKVFDKIPERNVVAWNAMIAGYAQNGNVNEALKLFQKMPQRDTVSWTAMIAGYVENRQVNEAWELFQKTPECNVVSWTAMIAGYGQNGQVGDALKLFQKMPERDKVSWTAMIAGCARNGQVDEALKLFQEMPERDVVSWSAMIAGFSQNGHFNETLKLFKQMQLTCAKPDPVTFTSVLPACANLAALINGKVIHENIIKSGFESHISVMNSLVDMYAKCGTIEDARQVFDKMHNRDIVSWNAMIVGYAKHGFGNDALQLFEQMQHSGTKPNDVTFIGVLSACSHAGLVDDGWQNFDRMSQDYHITPAVEHYCCMIDLLGRAGCLIEAHDFINQMPIEPNAAVWGSFLAACRIHANIELGERVAEQIFELDPKNDACYVLLSNIYALAGRWDDVEKVRKLMKDRRVNKVPGCSWIEVNNKVYSFLVRDRSHTQMHKIYAELERLYQQMEAEGYVPNTKLVLSDME